jgi:regulator of sirC expression with transglutaminase-like and TPR domain
VTLTRQLIDDFREAATGPAGNVAEAALLIARLEYPRLDVGAYLHRLDDMGAAAATRVEATARDRDPRARITALNTYLFDDEGFAGNRERYDDPRNSFLNEVLDRRTGIPITLAVVYMEVATRAGVDVRGVNFPGHFLLRCPAAERSGLMRDTIVDPFHGGAVLTEHDCRQLLRQHAGDEVAFDPMLLQPATKQQILIRMLTNLKRIYVQLRSFPQARAITDLLLAVDRDDVLEVRDRGLLSYHLQDYSAALRDLQTYLQRAPHSTDEDSRREHDQIWEHVKALRRRVASLN